MADWEEFNKVLGDELLDIPPPGPLHTPLEIDIAASTLTKALQNTIEKTIKEQKPLPQAKRWWNSQLEELRKAKNKLSTESYCLRALENHLDISTADIWTAHRYIKEPPMDGGRPRIPTLRTNDRNSREREVTDNTDKAETFAKAFFPPPPAESSVPEDYDYPELLPDPPDITEDQIRQNILKLSPYKVPGPDGIPNIVLQKSYDKIAKHLPHLFQGILQLNMYYEPWKEFTTVVLRKPGKPSYEM
ncbi:unnamed protein product [Cyclocybe aegerita]|uniref:Reverse transcriptase n=1 Tax=Cyclocybe aegerita TaxID=1973307 RepID=A0A8S0X0T1_CYCAE|nr:unnamed protein product [Cyclocybe aegerita]